MRCPDGYAKKGFSGGTHAEWGACSDAGTTRSRVVTNYDVIGDIQGHFDKLIGLLSRMGYSEVGGVWRHPERTAVFVGDLIDRGPRQVGVVDLVRGMVEAGAAHCVMGNHEFNALAYSIGAQLVQESSCVRTPGRTSSSTKRS